LRLIASAFVCIASDCVEAEAEAANQIAFHRELIAAHVRLMASDGV